MKIGPFSERFSLSPETVRYYINKGLLVPVVKNDRYHFSEQDIADMELLLKLKELRFSLAEIHKIISLSKLSNLDSAEELNDYLNILKRHKKELIREKHRLEQTIANISREISEAAEKHTVMQNRTSGVPLLFLPYLACPHCQGNLTINNCNIVNDQILSGSLICACGYCAAIQNGIIIGQTGEVSIYDGPDTERNCYRMMSPELINLMQRDYQWTLEKLNNIPTRGKLILEDYVNDYCFCHANLEFMDSQALYIITDKFPETVAMYKSLLDRKSLPHQILYIATAPQQLPLKEHCVDIYIDFASNECAIFKHAFSHSALGRYFNRETYGLGIFWHFPKGSETLAELQRQYPENWEHNFDLKYFYAYLQEHWQHINAFDDLGSVTDSGEGDSFSYHKTGEVLGLYSFQVKGYKGLKSS